jgi:hypothetical protein
MKIAPSDDEAEHGTAVPANQVGSVLAALNRRRQQSTYMI